MMRPFVDLALSFCIGIATASTANIFDGHMSHIVGGTDTDTNKYPHFANFEISYETDRNGNPIWLHLCGGSVITGDIVMGAAHCSKEAIYEDPSSVPMRVVVRGKGYPIVEEYNHPGFEDRNGLQNDIALFRTGSIIDSPRLAQLAVNEKMPEVGKPVQVVGHGFVTNDGPISEMLQEVSLEAFDCAPGVANPEIHICAGSMEAGRDSCVGDSGGPLYDIATGEVVGIVSYGGACGNAGEGAVYTRVAAFDSWIWTIVDQEATCKSQAECGAQFAASPFEEGFEVEPAIESEPSDEETYQCTNGLICFSSK